MGSSQTKNGAIKLRIDKKLNLIVPVGDEGEETYFYSTPIYYDVFKKYNLVICKTFTELLTAGLELTGAKIAAMQLEEVAIKMGKWEGREGVKDGLIGEIERLTNVLVMTDRGWDAIPVNVALQREYVAEEDWEEAKQRIVFFTLICSMTTKTVRDDLLTIMNSSWQTQTVSCSSMEFAASLPTSTKGETLKVPQSSVPV